MTYSVIIVQNRKIGIGVASGSIAVGSRVPHIEYPYCGVVSQGYTNPALGPIIANLIKQGYEARLALKEALRLDTNPKARQIAILTMSLDKAIYTGTQVPSNKGEYMDKDFVIVANLVREGVIENMIRSVASEDELSVRLYKTLLAGHMAGGDLRGDKSAALLIYGTTPFSPYYNKILDLRIDYSGNPLRDLRKLLELYGVNL